METQSNRISLMSKGTYYFLHFHKNGFHRYETDTGIKRTETAYVKNLESPVVVFSGTYYYGNVENGKVYIKYVADENGYVPYVRITGPSRKHPGLAEETPPGTTTTTEAPKYVYRAGIDLIESLIHNG